MWLVALILDSTDTEHFHHRQEALLDSAGLRQHPVPVAFYNFTVYGHLPKSYQSHNTIYVSSLSLPTSTEPPQGRASASFTSVSQDWKLPGVEQALNTYLLDGLVFQGWTVSKWSG